MDVVSVNLIRHKKEDYFFKFAQHSYLHIMNQKFMILQGGGGISATTARTTTILPSSIDF